jgi:hypothetical protein
MIETVKPKSTSRLLGMGITLLLIALVTLLSPIEKTLGSGIRLVYFHGAWVWAGLLTFCAAALTGLAGLLFRRIPRWSEWSLALGRTGMFFWLTYMPMSLLVMRLFWGGLFLDEPRWRIPMAFGIAGLLLQIAFWLIRSPVLTCLGNLVFGLALLWSLTGADNILHPDSPVFTSNSMAIQIYFVVLVLLSLLFGFQLARWIKIKTGGELATASQ